MTSSVLRMASFTPDAMPSWTRRVYFSVAHHSRPSQQYIRRRSRQPDHYAPCFGGPRHDGMARPGAYPTSIWLRHAAPLRLHTPSSANFGRAIPGKFGHFRRVVERYEELAAAYTVVLARTSVGPGTRDYEAMPQHRIRCQYVAAAGTNSGEAPDRLKGPDPNLAVETRNSDPVESTATSPFQASAGTQRAPWP